MTDLIRWAILSTGHMARKFVSDLRLSLDADVVAVGSRSLDSAREFAARHGIPRAFGSWAELADAPDVDVVYIANPASHHEEATLACLAAGRPVLVEKPLATDFASAQRMVEAARTAGVFLMEGMWMYCLPAIRAVAELVRHGAIGRPTVLSAGFGLLGPFAPGHRLRDRALGGGALLDLGIYPVALSHLLFGAPDRVRAVSRTGPGDVDDVTAILLTHPSGAVAALYCSIEGDTPNVATICGTTGRIELPRDFLRPQSFTVVRGLAEGVRTDLPHSGFGYHFEAAEVHRCLRAGLTESLLVPHDSTLSIMRTMDEVRAARGPA